MHAVYYANEVKVLYLRGRGRESERERERKRERGKERENNYTALVTREALLKPFISLSSIRE